MIYLLAPKFKRKRLFPHIGEDGNTQSLDRKKCGRQIHASETVTRRIGDFLASLASVVSMRVWYVRHPSTTKLQAGRWTVFTSPSKADKKNAREKHATWKKQHETKDTKRDKQTPFTDFADFRWTRNHPIILLRWRRSVRFWRCCAWLLSWLLGFRRFARVVKPKNPQDWLTSKGWHMPIWDTRNVRKLGWTKNIGLYGLFFKKTSLWIHTLIQTCRLLYVPVYIFTQKWFIGIECPHWPPKKAQKCPVKPRTSRNPMELDFAQLDSWSEIRSETKKERNKMRSEICNWVQAFGWNKRRIEIYGFSDPNFFVDKLRFVSIKKSKNLRCCIHQVIGCGEALWPGLLWRKFCAANVCGTRGSGEKRNRQVEDDSVKFSRGGQQMSGAANRLDSTQKQADEKMHFFFSVVPPTPTKTTRNLTNRYLPQIMGFGRGISFERWQFLGINWLNFSGCKSCLHVYMLVAFEGGKQIAKPKSQGAKVGRWTNSSQLMMLKECHW